MEKIETCNRCGFRVDPAEGNLDRTAEGEQRLMHSLTQCFKLTNEALIESGLPMERRADWVMGAGGARGQTRERDPTQKSS